jgi:SNF2 family DNA or RNA helicase
LDDEGDMLEKVIPGAVQISGRDSDDRKCEIYEAFASGQIKKLVIKPKIGAWGLNWQHCNHVVSFPSHSYEQYYQSIRRCYRFGQKKNVTVDVVATEGEIRVLGNMRAKAKRADAMFEALVQEMNSAVRIQRVNNYVNKVEAPQWL